MTATSNGLFAVIQALAAANTAGVGAQNQGLDSLSTSEFMTTLSQKLAQFHGNMDQIEEFLKSYLEHHGIGAETRENMNTGSILALGSVSEMLDKLKEFDQKLDAQEKKVEAAANVLKDASLKALDAKKNLHDLGYWVGIWSERLGWMVAIPFVGPVAAAAAITTAAAGEFAARGKDAANAALAADSAAATLKNETTIYTNLQTAQAALVTGKTGDMESQGNSLKAPAHSAIDNGNQIASMSLMFLESLERLVPQQV